MYQTLTSRKQIEDYMTLLRGYQRIEQSHSKLFVFTTCRRPTAINHSGDRTSRGVDRDREEGYMQTQAPTHNLTAQHASGIISSGVCWYCDRHRRPLRRLRLDPLHPPSTPFAHQGVWRTSAKTI